MNGLVIVRGDVYFARKKAKSAYDDDAGFTWSSELQAARVYQTMDSACRAANKCGGTVYILKDGRVVK